MSEEAKSLFISYRREDSAGYAGRLYDRLCVHFGPERVFMDVTTIQPGEDFVEAITRKVGSCAAALALVGKKWLGSADAQGRMRLKDPKDFVRLEILAALKRKIPVIPVLVGGAAMPLLPELPKALAPFARRQAFDLRDTHFHQDAAALLGVLERSVGPSSLAKVGSPEKAAMTQIDGNWAAEAVKEGGSPYPIFLTLEVFGEHLAGTVSYPTGTAGVLDGKIEGDKISFRTKHVPRFSEEEATIQWHGKVSEGEIEGITQDRDGCAKFRAKKDAVARRYGWKSG